MLTDEELLDLEICTVSAQDAVVMCDRDPEYGDCFLCAPVPTKIPWMRFLNGRGRKTKSTNSMLTMHLN